MPQITRSAILGYDDDLDEDDDDDDNVGEKCSAQRQEAPNPVKNCISGLLCSHL